MFIIRMNLIPLWKVWEDLTSCRETGIKLTDEDSFSRNKYEVNNIVATENE